VPVVGDGDREVGDTRVGREPAEPAHADGPAVGVEDERDVGLLVHGVEQDRQHPLELRVRDSPQEPGASGAAGQRGEAGEQ
jgi:hypothetical protein